MKNIKKNKKLFKIILIIYIILLLFFVILKLNRITFSSDISHILSDRKKGYWNFNFIPFKTIKYMIKSNNFINILGNIIPFLILGFLVSLSSEKFKIIRLIFKCFGLIIFFESLQFITCLGFFDIDDILINTLSCFIGIILYLIVKKRLEFL